MKYAFISEHRADFSVERMCRVFQVARGGYYEWRKRPYGPRLVEEAVLVDRIRTIHAAKKQRYGGPRITAQLRQEGRVVGKHRVARLLKANGLRAKARRKFKHTTDSAHRRPVAPNLVGRELPVTEPNQAWVGDITYIWTAEGWLYLAVVIDLFSRLIVGWALAARLRASLAVAALECALLRRGGEAPLIFHSDRGSQYASAEYQGLLAKRKIFGSMSGKGNCYDNAFSESLFHSLKVELVHDERYETRPEARTSVFEYMEVFYNRERLHSSLGYMSPVAYEAAAEQRTRPATELASCG